MRPGLDYSESKIRALRNAYAKLIEDMVASLPMRRVDKFRLLKMLEGIKTIPIELQVGKRHVREEGGYVVEGENIKLYYSREKGSRKPVDVRQLEVIKMGKDHLFGPQGKLKLQGVKTLLHEWGHHVSGHEAAADKLAANVMVYAAMHFGIDPAIARVSPGRIGVIGSEAWHELNSFVDRYHEGWQADQGAKMRRALEDRKKAREKYIDEMYRWDAAKGILKFLPGMPKEKPVPPAGLMPRIRPREHPLMPGKPRARGQLPLRGRARVRADTRITLPKRRRIRA